MVYLTGGLDLQERPLNSLSSMVWGNNSFLSTIKQEGSLRGRLAIHEIQIIMVSQTSASGLLPHPLLMVQDALDTFSSTQHVG